METDTIVTQDIFQFDYSMGIDSEGRFLGKMKPTGVRPTFMERLEYLGIVIPAETFRYEPPKRR